MYSNISQYDNFIPIRISNYNQFTRQQLVDFCNRHSRIVLIQEYKNYETKEGEHYHGWLNADISKQCLIKWITKELNCRGNQQYSLSGKDVNIFQGDREPYKGYCCKGENEHTIPELFFNIPEEEVRRYHEQYYIKQKEWIEEHNQNVRVKSKAKKELKHKLLEYIQLQDNLESQNHEVWVKRILMFFNEKDIVISNSSVENYVHYIRSKLEANYIDIRARSLVERIYRAF